MHRHRAGVALAAISIVVAGVPLAAAGGDESQLDDQNVSVHAADARTEITVHARRGVGRVPSGLLGVNHHYKVNGFGLWNPISDAPVPAVVAGVRQAGAQLVRYPGGTVANLFDWRAAIGSERECQVSGDLDEDAGGYGPVWLGQAYGPDEHMEFVRQAGAGAVLMVQQITETPEGAADWVEYMNARSGTAANPSGGVDWAEVRAANGHPAAYGVRLWEVGNEQRTKNQRYWMSANERVALRQYAFGGHRDVANEALGKGCDHPPEGVASDGSAHQVFELLYPPIVSRSVRLTVGGQQWRRVDGLGTAGPSARVYTLQPRAATVTFGDGQHGAVPAAGAVVRASYRSVHQGFFAFARAMKAVDPSIRVCASWGKEEFVATAGSRPYDCFSAHAYTHFEGEGHDEWATPLEGHDWHILGAATERKFVADLRAAVPRGTPMPLTEFGALWGDSETFPAWMASMTHAVYMATQWANWLDLGVPWSNGNDLLAANERGLLGPAPHYTVTAEVLTRQALLPMFEAGGERLETRLAGNPIRNPGLGAGTYRGLRVTATRGEGDAIHLLVVNRLPLESQAVTARVRLVGFSAAATASVRRVNGASFTSWNPPDSPPEVTLTTAARPVGEHGFVMSFPPHSVTVLRVPRG